MPNFTEASRVALHHIRGDNAVVYSATIDPTWGFNGLVLVRLMRAGYSWPYAGSASPSLASPALRSLTFDPPRRRTPHGGYILAVILRALTSFQHTTPLSPTPLTPSSSPPQPDPLSLSAQFLLPVTPGPVEVHVSIVRAGRTFTNLQAKLLHHTGGDNPGEVAVIVQAVFTRFPPVPAVDERGRHAPPSNGAMDLFPLSDSPYAEALKSPLLTHPSELMFDKSNKWDETGRRWSKESSLGSIKEGLWEWVADPRIEARRAGKGTEGRAVTLEWGGYTGMMDRADVVDLAVVAMTADVSASQPEVLPPAQRTNSP